MKPNIKLVIFDSYGVILTGGYPPTCKYLSKKYKKNWKELYRIFYTKYFNMAAERKITQQAAWQLALNETKLPLSAREIKNIHYGLMGLNSKVVTIAKALKKNYQILLLSKNTRSQFADSWKRFKQLKNTFEKDRINTWEYGLPKASKETIMFVAKKYKVSPKEILYIDDQEPNLKPAKDLGVSTIFYKNFNQFKREISRYIDL